MINGFIEAAAHMNEHLLMHLIFWYLQSDEMTI